ERHRLVRAPEGLRPHGRGRPRGDGDEARARRELVVLLGAQLQQRIARAAARVRSTEERVTTTVPAPPLPRAEFERACGRPLIGKERFVDDVGRAVATGSGYAAGKIGVSERA